MNWKETLCLDEKIYLILPDDWIRPSEETVAKKFPYRQKPQEIFASLDTHCILTFNLLEKPLQEKQVYPAILEIQRVIGHIYPESVLESSTLFQAKTGKAGYFSFITGGMECNNCHYMFVLPIDGKMMLGSYHFPESQTREESPVFFEVLNSIRESRCNGED